MQIQHRGLNQRAFSQSTNREEKPKPISESNSNKILITTVSAGIFGGGVTAGVMTKSLGSAFLWSVAGGATGVLAFVIGYSFYTSCYAPITIEDESSDSELSEQSGSDEEAPVESQDPTNLQDDSQSDYVLMGDDSSNLAAFPGTS